MLLFFLHFVNNRDDWRTMTDDSQLATGDRRSEDEKGFEWLKEEECSNVSLYEEEFENRHRISENIFF